MSCEHVRNNPMCLDCPSHAERAAARTNTALDRVRRYTGEPHDPAETADTTPCPPPRECPFCHGCGGWDIQVGPEDWDRDVCLECRGTGTV